MKVNLYLIPYAIINAKWIKDLNERTKTIKLFEVNRVNHCDLEFVNGFLDMIPKSTNMATKEKHWIFIKIMNLSFLKDTIKNMKSTAHTMKEHIYKSYVR